uniref:Uncharacterized protein n=1 Tax=Rhizophora mucronata TaxID=61149 RepID=A0A2P2II09_RHIMU
MNFIYQISNIVLYYLKLLHVQSFVQIITQLTGYYLIF